MPDAIPACFRGRAAGGPPPSTAAGPSLTTSIYDTHHGAAALTWSRTVFGLSLSADLRLSDPSGRPPGEDDDEPLRIRVRPWLFWKRRGSKQFHFQSPRHTVEIAWDLTRSRFPAGGGPEPSAGFFVAVAVDGEMLLVAGDLGKDACKKMRSARPKMLPSSPVLVSRREHVVMKEVTAAGGVGGGGGRKHRTMARFGGEEREISIELGGGGERWDSGMSVAVGGKQVLQVRRLRWKFRGSEEVEVEGGTRVQVFWDLHNWMFRQPKESAAAPPPSPAGAPPELGSAAVFMFRIERDAVGGEEAVKRGYFSRPMVCGPGIFHQNWSGSSSGGDGGSAKGKGRRKSLLKESSFSSSSSAASSASSSTVMGWASPEEAKLRSADCFSLLVYAWKS